MPAEGLNVSIGGRFLSISPWLTGSSCRLILQYQAGKKRDYVTDLVMLKADIPSVRDDYQGRVKEMAQEF